MRYVFDTSSLIGGWVRLYPPRNFPRLWDELDALVAAGELVTPEEVLDELKAQDDDLLAWAKGRRAMLVPTNRDLMLAARDVLSDHPHLTKTGTGRGKADPFVIALAAQLGCPVVTEERGGSADKPRIPYVCGARGIACMSLLEVITAEGWIFV